MKWEYIIIHCPPGSTNLLNEVGAEGWELVAVIAGWGYFKRKVTAKRKAATK